jgi:archaellin
MCIQGCNQATLGHPGASLNLCSHDTSFEIKVIPNTGSSILINFLEPAGQHAKKLLKHTDL